MRTSLALAVAMLSLGSIAEAQTSGGQGKPRATQSRGGEVERGTLVFDGVRMSVRAIGDGAVEVSARRPDRTVVAVFAADSLARWVDSAAAYLRHMPTVATRDSLGAFEGPIVRGGHPAERLSTLQLTPSDSTGRPGFMLYLQNDQELHLQPEVSAGEARRFLAAVRQALGGKVAKPE